MDLKYQTLQLDNGDTCQYLSVIGKDNFKKLLTTLLTMPRENKHYILLQIFEDKPLKKSLIEINMANQPIQFKFRDLNKRKAIDAEKKAATEFLLESCTEKERSGPNFWDWFQRGGPEGVLERAKATINSMPEPLADDPLKDAFLDLKREKAVFTQSLGAPEPAATKGWVKALSMFGNQDSNQSRIPTDNNHRTTPKR